MVLVIPMPFRSAFETSSDKVNHNNLQDVELLNFLEGVYPNAIFPKCHPEVTYY